MQWFAACFSLPAQAEELAVAVLAARGHRSCEIRQAAGAAGTDIVVYFQAPDVRSAEARAHTLLEATNAAIADTFGPSAPTADVTVEPVAEADWRENWKQFFPRLRVGCRIEVVPPWEAAEPSEPERVVIVIDPGMAFGTGHHETTSGCLELLERFMRPGAQVADVGCGSGILAIAAARLGAARVVAVDVDPIAVNAARANIVTNRVREIVVVKKGSGPPPAEGQSKEGFDLVFANVYAEELVAMHDRLTSCVKQRGVIVLSGIESGKRRLIEDCFVGSHWQISATVERGPWWTVALARSV